MHHMTAGFGMCLPTDRASHLLIACSPCFRPEMCAKSFWRQRLPTTGGSLCLLHCLEENSFRCYSEIWNCKQRGRWEIYFFFPAAFLYRSWHLSTLWIATFFGFECSWYAVFLFFFFSAVSFRFFFLKHFLPSTSFYKINCSGMIYASASKFLLLYSIIPMLFQKKKRQEKKTLKNRVN